MTPASDHQLTAGERQRGLEHALAAREARAELKAAVANGDMGIDELLDLGRYGEGDLNAGRIELADALLALPGIGRAHAARVLAELDLDGSEHLNSLTGDQRANVLRALEDAQTAG